MGLSLLPVRLPLLWILHRGRSWVWKLEDVSEGLIPGTFHLELDGSQAGPVTTSRDGSVRFTVQSSAVAHYFSQDTVRVFRF